MKKIIIALALVVILVGPILAESISLLPDLGSSSWITMYDCHEHNLKTGLRYPAFGWEFIYVDGQVVTDMDTIALAVGGGFELIALVRYCGLKVYLTQAFNLGFNYGRNFQKNKPVWGPWGGIKINF